MPKFKLTKHQLIILDHILSGAEIQLTQLADKLEYDLVFENGNTEKIKRESFESLKDQKLIQRKYNPSVDAERWA